MLAATFLLTALAELAAVREYKAAAISPQGDRLAYVMSLPGANKLPSRHTGIFLADLGKPGSQHQRIAPHRIAPEGQSAAHSDSSPVWSPDGTHLAFLSDIDKAGQPQLYVAPLNGGRTRRLTQVKGSLQEPRWSPDGRKIAILYIENAPNKPGPLEPVPLPSGDVEEAVFEQRLAVVDAAAGPVRALSPADMYVYEYDWSPGGKQFAVTAAHGSGDNHWYVARIYTVSADTGKTREIFHPAVQQQIAAPRWSADGRSVLFIGGLMSDEGATGGELFSVPATGGAAKNLTPDYPGSISNLRVLSSGKLLFTEHRDGGSAIAILDPASGKAESLWSGEETLTGGDDSGLSVAADGKTVAVVRQSWRQPPEIWAGAIGAWKQVTRENAQRKPAWGEAKNLHWTTDAGRVQGWLLYPAGYDPARRYPMVVSVHGGPASVKKPSWPRFGFEMALLSQAGYFVLYPNPRGSYGQGEKFTLANVKDFGGGDLRDIVAGVDEVLRTLPVDPRRVGITGWSYGGYMTMWAVTQSNRFRAAVAGAGIANWQSYYGQNAIDQWMIPFFGASVYDDPAVYAKSSPINFIKQVKTPTLLVVGDRDGECPPAQSYEFWHALKTLGVPTRMVVYPNEGHRIAKPEHRRDVIERTIAWFDQYLR